MPVLALPSKNPSLLLTSGKILHQAFRRTKQPIGGLGTSHPRLFVYVPLGQNNLVSSALERFGQSYRGLLSRADNGHNRIIEVEVTMP